METKDFSLEIIKLFKEAKAAYKKNDSSKSILGNTFYLKNDAILSLRNPYGDSRYPYSKDGLTLWAYTSGNLSINESNFFITPLEVEGKEPYLNFYAGIKNKDKYNIFSMTSNADTEFGEDLLTYVIYTKSHCYYIREVNKIITCLKLTVTDDKRVLFSTAIINNSKKTQEVLSSIYFNPLLTHTSVESEETKWFRTVEIKEDKALFTSIEDLSREIHLYNYGLLNVAGNEDERLVASRRMDYVGDKNKSISLSKCLRKGFFDNSDKVACFTDMAIYGDIAKKKLNPGDMFVMNYQVRVAFSQEDFKKLQDDSYDFDTNAKLFKQNIKPRQKRLDIKFGPFDKKYDLDNELFNNFLRSVVDQVDYATITKNSTIQMLGIRDVYQMMEVSLVWNKEKVREKILDSIASIDISGRAPRQYSQIEEGRDFLMDNRAFIDQGEWIISTIYKYLCWTKDKSILKEKRPYVELIGLKKGRFINKYETVKDHLVRIINYLISNIDEDTNCLKALYGDWNDAVDGLGKTKDSNKEFGNGVSVMATCHLYLNLFEISEILDDPKYLEIAKRIEEGFLKHAIQRKDGHARILHGWGEDKSFYVGSYKDVDDVSRVSVTSHAAFVMSGLLEKHPEYKDAILDAYNALDSKYGLLTFDHYFDRNKAAQVGRIVNLPKGTAENSATYIHGAMFMVRALLQMNETEKAFDQIYKMIPITHKKVSTSPFVMPNSYGYNKDLYIDGESMSDWYTGSSNTLLKAIIYDMFGIKPTIDGYLRINPVKKFPSDSASIRFEIGHKKIIVNHYNDDKNERSIYINGERFDEANISLSEHKSKYIVDIYN